jgi:glucose/arabinose dehydrogenase
MIYSVLCRYNIVLILFIFIQAAYINAQPKPTRSNITIKQITTLKTTAVRIRRDPSTGNLYILNNDGVIQRVDFNVGGTASLTTLYKTADHSLTEPLGMTFDKKGNVYLVGNETTGWELATGVIMRGERDSLSSEKRTWKILAQTVPYPYGHVYSHKMSGIVIDTSGKYIFINSGARTDHGEIEDSLRETGLTSIILKLPINGSNIILQNDREWLRSNGYLFAEGIRNTFDMAYSADGDLFGTDNSDDRDDPEEMNWLQEGHHYGFPWRLGGDNTPQQYTPYNPKKDPLLNPATWGGGNLYQTYSEDSTYPPPPAGVTFTEPIPSAGPDADKFRDTVTGQVKDASQLGLTISTFTPHRSPDGIVFDVDSILANDLKGGAFVISVANSNLVAALTDTSDDLLHVSLSKTGGSYSAKVTRIVSGFNSPLGIEVVGNKIYVAETGLEAFNNAPKLWEVTLPAEQSTGIQSNLSTPKDFTLNQNYPNPFNPSTTIRYSMAKYGNVKLIIYNILGEKIRALINSDVSPGNYEIQWDGKDDDNVSVSSGVYFIQMTSGANFISTKKMLLLK